MDIKPDKTNFNFQKFKSRNSNKIPLPFFGYFPEQYTAYDFPLIMEKKQNVYIICAF